VIGGKVEGKLGISRSFGDYEFKDHKFITCAPDLFHVRLTQTTDFILLACDGLYDVFTNDEVVTFINTRIDKEVVLETIANELVEEAIDRGSTDNITVVIVKFNPKCLKKFLKTIRKRPSKLKPADFPVRKTNTPSAPVPLKHSKSDSEKWMGRNNHTLVPQTSKNLKIPDTPHGKNKDVAEPRPRNRAHSWDSPPSISRSGGLSKHSSMKRNEK